MTEEHKRKLSLANKGQVPWSKGKHLSKTHRQRIAQSHKGFKHTEATKRKISRAKIGIVRPQSQEERKRRSESFKGSNNPQWKGGRKYHSDGYILIHKPEHPFADVKGYVLEHRLVMEKHIGRYLKPEEVVHHINGVCDDNRIENLKLFPNEVAHRKFHHLLHSALSK